MTEYDKCVYTHDISEEGRNVDIFKHMDGEEWSCHHPAGEDAEYCLFHQPIEVKDDQSVVKRFLEVVNTGYEELDLPSQERFRFIGAKFGDFSLPLFTTLATGGQFEPAAAEYPLDLRDIHVDGSLHWSNTTIRHGLLFDGAFVAGKVDISETRIEADCSFTSGQFNGIFRFDNVEMDGELRVDQAEFELAASIAWCDIEKGMSLKDGYICAHDEMNNKLEDEVFKSGDLFCQGSRFGNEVTFNRLVVESGIHCSNTNITGDMSFHDAEVESKVNFSDAEITGDVGAYDVEVGGDMNFSDAEVTGSVKLSDAKIKSDTRFSSADITGGVNLKEAIIQGYAYFTDASIEGDQANLSFIGVEIQEEVWFIDAHVGCNAWFENAHLGGDIKFGGASIDDMVDFEDTVIEGEVEFHDTSIGGTVDLQDADIENDADFEKAHIEGYARFHRAQIGGDVTFKKASIGISADFTDSRIEGGAYFYKVIIEVDVNFENAHVEGDISCVMFKYAKINGDATFEDACIKGNADFRHASIDGSVYFSYIEGDARFKHAYIGGRAGFEKVRIEGGADFLSADLEGDADFEGAYIEDRADFKETKFKGTTRCATFVGAEIKDTARFSEAHIEGDARFSEAHIEGDARFSEAHIEGDAEFSDANIDTNASFSDARIEGGAEFADIKGDAWFEEAQIEGGAQFADIKGDAYFEEAQIEGGAQFSNIEGDARFEDAQFKDGVDFEDSHIEGHATFFTASIEGYANFSGVSIEGGYRGVIFYNSDIQGEADFTEAHIETDADFRKVNIEGRADFRNARTQGSVDFKDAWIKDDAIFEGDFIKSLTLEKATVLGNADINARFGDAPVLYGITVGETLSLGCSLDGDTNIIDIRNGAIGSIQIGSNARTHILRLNKSTISQFLDDEIPDARILDRWSLEGLRFDEFDFTASREVLTALGWDFHHLRSDARERLSHNAVADDARDDAYTLVDILVGIPAVTRSIDNGELDTSNLSGLLSFASKTVFSNETLARQVIAGEADIESVTDDPLIKGGGDDTKWIYTVDAAEAVYHLSERVTNDAQLFNAVKKERVSMHLSDIAETIANFNPEVAPGSEAEPSEQIDMDSLSIEELRTALSEVYADPDDFRASNNPEAWEETYLDAKVAASDQGLNEVAAEFFLREKRFKRKRHARRVHENDSLFGSMRAAFDWVSNLTMDVTTGYGERPRNVVVSSLGTVGVFAAIYWMLGALQDHSSPLEYLLFSFQGFIQFILGVSPRGDLLIRLATAIEGFIGAFLIALFVFTLTRSLNR